jgi:hypothetical protein
MKTDRKPQVKPHSRTVADVHMARVDLDRLLSKGWLQRVEDGTRDSLPSIYPSASGGSGGGSSGGPSNPTERIAMASAGRRHDLAALAAQAATVREQVGRLVGIAIAIESRYGTAALVAATITLESRCAGGEGDWADPACENNAVTNVGMASGHTMPLCSACRQRMYRAPQAKASFVRVPVDAANLARASIAGRNLSS